MRGRKPSTTRHLTKTGHHAPHTPPPPVVDPTVGRRPPGLTGAARLCWDLYVAERTALGVWHALDRVSLTLACRAIQAKDSAEARRWLAELCATPATRMKILGVSGAIQPNAAKASSQPSSIRERLALVTGGSTAGA